MQQGRAAKAVVPWHPGQGHRPQATQGWVRGQRTATKTTGMTREVASWGTVMCVRASVQTEEIFGVFAALVVRGDVGAGGHVGVCGSSSERMVRSGADFEGRLEADCGSAFGQVPLGAAETGIGQQSTACVLACDVGRCRAPSKRGARAVGVGGSWSERMV